MKRTDNHAIPTKSLPKEWRDLGAKKFSCSKSSIEKVVYGITTNIEILGYMVELAEEKKASDQILLDRINAVKA
jgi:hypothetical protein